MATSTRQLKLALTPSHQAIGHDRNPGELSRSVFGALIRHRSSGSRAPTERYQLHWFTPAGRFKRFDDERRTARQIGEVCAKAYAAAREIEDIQLPPPPRVLQAGHIERASDVVSAAHVYLHTLVLTLVGEALRNAPPAEVDRRWKREQALVINLLEERIVQ